MLLNTVVNSFLKYSLIKRIPGGSVLKNPPANAGDVSLILGQEDTLEKEMATHSSVLAWEIPWRGAWQATVSGVARGGCDLAVKPQSLHKCQCHQRKTENLFQVKGTKDTRQLKTMYTPDQTWSWEREINFKAHF